MKTRDIVIIAGLGLLAYYLLMRKKPLMKEDLPAGSGGSKSPVFSGKASPTPPTNTGGVKQPVTVEDLSLKIKPALVPQEYVMHTLEKPALRVPVSIPATNLIPSVYDREINKPMPVNDQFYASFAGACSESMESACKCASTRKEKYKLDIPKLP